MLPVFFDESRMCACLNTKENKKKRVDQAHNLGILALAFRKLYSTVHI